MKEKESASNSPATSLNGESSPMLQLSPKTRDQFQSLRNTLDQPDDASTPDADESLDRLNELMRCVYPIS